MRFLAGLVAVATIALTFIILGVDDSGHVKRCPLCVNDSIVMTQSSIGGPSHYTCTVCGTNFRRASDGGPLVRV
jgi:transposase-like protein